MRYEVCDSVKVGSEHRILSQHNSLFNACKAAFKAETKARKWTRHLNTFIRRSDGVEIPRDDLIAAELEVLDSQKK